MNVCICAYIVEDKKNLKKVVGVLGCFYYYLNFCYLNRGTLFFSCIILNKNMSSSSIKPMFRNDLHGVDAVCLLEQALLLS